MRKKSLLVVEDCPEQLLTYSEYAHGLGFTVLQANCADAAMEILTKNSIDILLCDIHLSPSLTIDTFEGFRVIQFAAEHSPETVTISMSNDPKVATYHRAFEVGAMAYIKKPILRKDEITIALESAKAHVATQAMKAKLAFLQTESEASDRYEDGIILDPIKRKLAEKLATTKAIPIIIYGETGTGKEEYVKLIHKKREVAEKGEVPFISINCANLDSSVAIATLFGHTKGAFTGADRTTKGAIGEADGGILFLDEIHLLPIDCQKRLLRVLNDGSYERLGDTKTLKSDFQVIVATTKDLDEMVEKGTFILDLRMRISGAEITMEPLRKRTEDIPSFVTLFLKKFGAKIDEVEFLNIVERCKDFYWQGNIRQLYKAIQSLVTMASLYDQPVLAKNLPVSPLMLDPEDRSSSAKNGDDDLMPRIMAPLEQDMDFSDAVAFYEKMILAQALVRHRKIKDLCAGINIPRSTFEGKRAKFGLDMKSE